MCKKLDERRKRLSGWWNRFVSLLLAELGGRSLFPALHPQKTSLFFLLFRSFSPIETRAFVFFESELMALQVFLLKLRHTSRFFRSFLSRSCGFHLHNIVFIFFHFCVAFVSFSIPTNSSWPTRTFGTSFWLTALYDVCVYSWGFMPRVWFNISHLTWLRYY